MPEIQFTFNGVCGHKTKKGTPCQHTVIFANGRCKQHGGNSTAFMRERHARLAEKNRRRLERRERKLKRLGIEQRGGHG